MMHQIQCKCSSVKGHIKGTGTSNRVICYFADCRAFAQYLGCSDDVLDAHGGTEIVQVAQPRLAITHGKAHLATVRLSKKGMVRWYAACCNTPIGNTLANPKISFIGLIHSSLDHSKLDEDFGNNIAIVNTGSATGDPKPKQKGIFGTIIRFIRIILPTRISGNYRKSQLFNESSEPIAAPVIISAEQLNVLKNSL